MNENNEEKEQPEINSTGKELSKEFSKLIYGVFFWCMIGVSIIYGIRLYFDVPVHSSFLPIVGAVFAGILAFTLVVSFQSKAGPIDITRNNKLLFKMTIQFPIRFLSAKAMKNQQRNVVIFFGDQPSY